MSPSEIIIALIIALSIVVGIFGVYALNAFGSYGAFLDWFYSRERVSAFAILGFVFGVLNVGLLTGAVIFIRRYHRLWKAIPTHVPGPELKPDEAKDEARDAWEHIRELANSENPSDWNSAVLRADALLNDVLADLGYEGESFADRMRIVDPTILKSVDRVWSAHRLRNMIAHEPLEQQSRQTIIEALRSYEQALRELGMISETKKDEPPAS